jgi:hypothetical protein
MFGAYDCKKKEMEEKNFCCKMFVLSAELKLISFQQHLLSPALCLFDHFHRS